MLRKGTVDNDSFQTIKVMRNYKNNVYVKCAQPGNGVEANVGNDTLHVIRVPTQSKWEKED